MAQSVWWIASIIGLTEGLVTYIDNLRIRSEVYSTPAAQSDIINQIHPDRFKQITVSREISAISKDFTEDKRHDQVIKNCEEFLQDSVLERTKAAKRILKASKRLSKTRGGKVFKPQKIKQEELRKRYPGCSDKQLHKIRDSLRKDGLVL